MEELRAQAERDGSATGIRSLLERLAAEEGGAAVVDQVHDELKKGEHTKGDTL